MTPAQIDDVKRSFALVAPIADQAGMLFYTHLFEIDPTLRALFKGDIETQSKIDANDRGRGQRPGPARHHRAGG
jgi:hypothetical protein